MGFISDRLKWRKQFKYWRKKNSHNNTSIQSYFDIDRVNVGRYTYGMINAHTYSGERTITIGDFCSIAENVHFVLGEHDYSRVSTFPFDRCLLNHKETEYSKGDIVVEDDVWIGMNCTILSGVTIHRGAVIGAGSVVSSDVPAYSIFAGGKILKRRFNDDIIDRLMYIDFSKLTEEMVKKYRDCLYSDIDDFLESDLYNLISC